MRDDNNFSEIIYILAGIKESSPPPNPLRVASARRNYLEYASRLKTKRRAASSALSQPIFMGFRLALKVMTVVLLAVCALFAGTAYAAAASLPGDLIYPLGLQIEEIQLGLTREPEQATRLALSFADKRLDEVERLLALGREEHIPVALKEYERIIKNPRLADIGAGPGQGELSLIVVDALTEQEDKLLEIRKQASFQSNNAFDAAVEVLAAERQKHRLNTPRRENPGQGNPGQGNPNPPGQGNPGQGNPNPPGQGNPGQGNPNPPGQGNPGQGNPNPPGQGNPGQGNPNPPGQGNPGQGNPNPPGQGNPGQGNPNPPGQDKDKDKDKGKP